MVRSTLSTHAWTPGSAPANSNRSTPSAATAEMITPELAAEWLVRNKRNRTLNRALIETYARDMWADNWKLTGEAVKFDLNGDLIDGQHRLHAIVLAQKPVALYVVRGIDPDAQFVLDTGRKRTAADALQLQGHTVKATTLAAAARLGVGWTEGEIKFSVQSRIRTITHAEVFQFVAANPDLVEATGQAVYRIQIPPSVLAFTIWLTRRVDIDDATTFFSQLHEHRTEGPGDPLLTLTRRLSAIAAGREKTPQVTLAYLVIRTWNAWRKHETIHNLKVSNAHGPFAFPEPI